MSIPNTGKKKVRPIHPGEMLREDFLPDYLEQEVLEADPFQTLDQTGVGQLVRTAVKLGRGAKKALKYVVRKVRHSTNLPWGPF